MSNLVPYNISLPAASGVFSYAPLRGVGASVGWNMTFTDSTTFPNGELDFPGEGTAFFRTAVNGAEITLSFEGTGLYLCLTPNGGAYALTVDGTLFDTKAPGTDNACKDFGADTVVVAGGLKFGKHDALLRVSADSDAEMHFFGAVVTTGLKTIGKGGKVESRMIDDTDKDWSYKPSRGPGVWDSTTKPATFNLTSTFDCLYNAEQFATYKFKGYSAVVLLGALYRDTRVYTVTLDGEAFKSDVSPGGWTIGSAPMFLKGGLDPDVEHTLVFTNFRDDNEKCLMPKPVAGDLFCCSAIDALQLFRVVNSGSSEPSATPIGTTPSPKKSNVGVVAGGVVAAVVAAALAVLLFVLCRRRSRRRRAKVDSDGPPATVPSASRSQSPNMYGVVEPFSVHQAASRMAPHDASSPPVSYGGKLAAQAVSVPAPSSVSHGSQTTNIPFTTRPDSTDLHTRSQTPMAESGFNASTTRLAPEDLNQVLAYVAQQMDPTRREALRAGETLPPPTYRP